MTDFSVTPPVRRLRAVALWHGVEVSRLHLHGTTDDVVACQRDEHTEVQLDGHGPIDVRQPHHEDGETQRVDQAESHAHPTAVDQHDQRGDGQEHEDEQCEVHPSVVTGLGPVHQDPHVDEAQDQPRPGLEEVLDRFHFSPLLDDDRPHKYTLIVYICQYFCKYEKTPLGEVVDCSTTSPTRPLLPSLGKVGGDVAVTLDGAWWPGRSLRDHTLGNLVPAIGQIRAIRHDPRVGLAAVKQTPDLCGHVLLGTPGHRAIPPLWVVSLAIAIGTLACSCKRDEDAEEFEALPLPLVHPDRRHRFAGSQ